MAYSRRFRGRLAEPLADPVATRHTFTGGGLLGHDLSAAPWLVNVSEQTALALDVVQGCVQLISDAVAGSDVGQWNGLQRIDPPSGFTLRPDPDVTRRDFLWRFAGNLALYNAVYLEEATVGGQAVGVRVHCIDTVTRIGDELYIGGKRTTNRMRLVRRSSWPTLDLDSSRVISLAREVFAGAMAANSYQSDYWQQGGTAPVYIKTEQEITTDQATAIGNAWTEKRTTTPGTMPVLGKGADIKSTHADLAQAGTHESADRMRASMARYFLMPPSYVNVPSEAGALQYQTEQQLAIWFVKHTLSPYTDTIGEALSSYLPGDYLLGDRIVIDPSKYSRGDQLGRYTAWESALRAGWIDAEEVRTQEGLAPGAPEPKPAPVEAVNVRA